MLRCRSDGGEEGMSATAALPKLCCPARCTLVAILGGLREGNAPLGVIGWARVAWRWEGPRAHVCVWRR